MDVIHNQLNGNGNGCTYECSDNDERMQALVCVK